MRQKIKIVEKSKGERKIKKATVPIFVNKYCINMKLNKIR